MELPEILAEPEGPQRTAHLVAWIQGLFESGDPPVLVGGAAVELYTGGGYTTGDLDFVGVVPSHVATLLKKAGFARQGRHWIHEKAQVFVEFPGSALAGGERAVRLRVGDCEVVAIAPEDLLAERLGAWKHWRSAIDGVNAWLLFLAFGGRLDDGRLRQRCAAHEADDALRALRSFAQEWPHSRPPDEEVLEWAQRGV
jgi:hypothetical protein